MQAERAEWRAGAIARVEDNELRNGELTPEELTTKMVSRQTR
jgi:hypothetical protein